LLKSGPFMPIMFSIYYKHERGPIKNDLLLVDIIYIIGRYLFKIHKSQKNTVISTRSGEIFLFPSSLGFKRNNNIISNKLNLCSKGRAYIIKGNMNVFINKWFGITAIALVLFSLPAQSEDMTQNNSVIGQKIARTYGIEHFDEVLELKYTFNAKIGEKTISRSWVWVPKDNQVTYIEDDGTTKALTYNRENISDKSDSIKEVDSKFINDQYWLLFPFHLVWDEGIRIEVEDEQMNLPIGSGITTKVRVIYPDTGGYTPGDIYELFIDDNYMILEWIYRRGGSETPTRISTWQDNTQFGPITISLNHLGPDENFRIWFTDIEVKTD